MFHYLPATVPQNSVPLFSNFFFSLSSLRPFSFISTAVIISLDFPPPLSLSCRNIPFYIFPPHLVLVETKRPRLLYARRISSRILLDLFESPFSPTKASFSGVSVEFQPDRASARVHTLYIIQQEC